MALLLLAFLMGSRQHSNEHDACCGNGEAASGEAASAGSPIYYCSMHPQVRSPDPDDKCPICFMDLIPLPDDDDEGDDGDVPRLRVSARAAALMDIRTLPAERRAVEVEIGLFGKVDFDESRLFNVPARTEAYIERLVVNTPWQPVAQGETLAELYSPAAVTAMRELKVASGEATIEAARARLRRMGISEAQITNIEKKEIAPRTFRVESPVAGVVYEITAREGDLLREGALLTRVADLSRVWINLEAYERDLPWLAAGQKALISVASQPGRSFEGELAFVEPVVNPRTRTARLRVEAENTDGQLKPGMYANAVIHAPYHSPTTDALPLVVPVSAPLITGRRALVYVRIPDEERPTFEPRRITLGPRAGEVFIVEEGLEEGDLVVVNGQFKLDSELQIRGRPSMMAPEAPAEEAEPVATDGLQANCPVMGGPINRDFFHDHDGWRIYVCCPPCLDELRERADEIIAEQRKKGIVFEPVPEAGE